MNILLVNYEYPPLGGGAGNATFFTARELVKAGHQVSVLTSGFKKLPAYTTEKSIEIHRLPVLRKTAFRATMLEIIAFVFSSLVIGLKKVKQIGPDVIIVYFSIPCGQVGYFALKLFKIPYLISLRGGDIHGYGGGKLTFLMQRLTLPLNKLFMKNALSVVANSHGLQSLASQYFKPVELIPNGVDTVLYHPILKKSNNGKNVFNLVFAGRLSSEKGINVLLKALAANALKNREWQLNIIGDGMCRTEWKVLSENLGLNTKVNFLGWQDKTTLIKYYQQADIFVFPSLYEGMSNAILEALATGLPVLSTDIPENKQLLQNGKNSILVKPNSVNDLSEKLLAIFNNEYKLDKLVPNTRQTALNYSWQNVALMYLALIKRKLSADVKKQESV